MSADGLGTDRSLELFKVVSLGDLRNASWEETEYVIPKLLPVGHVSLLSANGGVGKSYLSLIWAAHAAAGHAWADFPISLCRVLYVSLEDPGCLMKGRLKTIIDVYGLNEGLVTENLEILDGSAGETTLATESVIDGVRVLRPTQAMDQLNSYAKDRRLVVIDNASYAFYGNENDRRQVSTFIRSLIDLARESDAAVILLAHVDKATAKGKDSRGEMTFSGSTAWHNGPRSRLALTSKNSSLELRQEKLNLGEKLVAPIRLEWRDGILLPRRNTAPAPLTQDEQGELDMGHVLGALNALWLEQRCVPTSTTGRGNQWEALLPKLRGFNGRIGRNRLSTALERLRASGRIKQEHFLSPSRHSRERWVRGDALDA